MCVGAHNALFKYICLTLTQLFNNSYGHESWRRVVWNWESSKHSRPVALFPTLPLPQTYLSLRLKMWKMTHQAITFSVKAGFTSTAFKNIDRQLDFIMSNALLITEPAFAWCLWNLAATALLTGKVLWGQWAMTCRDIHNPLGYKSLQVSTVCEHRLANKKIHLYCIWK